jgi:hypothetical protein
MVVTSEPKQNGTASVVATQIGLQTPEADDAARGAWAATLDSFLGDDLPAPDGRNACHYDHWERHPHYDVANFHRVVVHGSTAPLENLKLVVTPGGRQATTATTFGPFSWSRQMVN